MSAIRQNDYGMLTGKKIFFYGANNSILTCKITQILQRLEAVVEPFFNNDIEMIITDEDVNPVVAQKRKFSTPLPYRSKKLRLITGAVKTNSNENRNDDEHGITKGDFLAKAIAMGCKIKTMKGIWSWLSQFYGHLVENCYVENNIVCSDSIDEQYKVKNMSVPAIKILDPFGGCRPLVHANCTFADALFAETHVVKKVVNHVKGRSSGRVSLHKAVIETTGFCECCRCNFTSTYSHLTDTGHQAFAKNGDNFSGMDKILLPVSDLDKFFNSRLSMQQKYIDSKLAVRLSIRPKTEIELHSPKHCVVGNTQACVTQNCEKSSSSGTSSSGQSSEDSSDYSSDDEKDDSPIFSTPLPKRHALASFLQDSISNEDVEQSQLSQHVDDIVSHLSLLELPHLNVTESDDKVDEVIEIVGVNEQFRGLFLPNRGNSSLVISQRFKWCLACGRNHVPVEEHQYQCHLGPADKDDNTPMITKDQSSDECVISTTRSSITARRSPLDTDIDLEESMILQEKAVLELSYYRSSDTDEPTQEDALLPPLSMGNGDKETEYNIVDSVRNLRLRVSACRFDVDLPGSMFSTEEDESECVEKENISKISPKKDLQMGDSEFLSIITMSKEGCGLTGLPLVDNGHDTVTLAGMVMCESNEDEANGESGKNGEIGESGKNGENGKIGKNGEIKESGKNGENGKIGENVEIKESGKNGENGKIGEIGKNGEIKEIGKNGEIWESGKIGKNGKIKESEEIKESGENSEIGKNGENGNIEDLSKMSLSNEWQVKVNDNVRGTHNDIPASMSEECYTANLLREDEQCVSSDMRNQGSSETIEMPTMEDDISVLGVEMPVAIRERVILTPRRVKRVSSVTRSRKIDIRAHSVALSLEDRSGNGHFEVSSMERDEGDTPGHTRPQRLRRTAAIVANLCIVSDDRPKSVRRSRGALKLVDDLCGSEGDKENGEGQSASSPRKRTSSVMNRSAGKDKRLSHFDRRKTVERSLSRISQLASASEDEYTRASSCHTDSPGRAQRTAAVFANHGIRNTNRLLNSDVATMIKCLEKSYVPRQYDPRVRMSNLKFSPEEIKTRKSVFKENNQ